MASLSACSARWGGLLARDISQANSSHAPDPAELFGASWSASQQTSPQLPSWQSPGSSPTRPRNPGTSSPACWTGWTSMPRPTSSGGGPTCSPATWASTPYPTSPPAQPGLALRPGPHASGTSRLAHNRRHHHSRRQPGREPAGQRARRQPPADEGKPPGHRQVKHRPRPTGNYALRKNQGSGVLAAGFPPPAPGNTRPTCPWGGPQNSIQRRNRP